MSASGMSGSTKSIRRNTTDMVSLSHREGALIWRVVRAL